MNLISKQSHPALKLLLLSSYMIVFFTTSDLIIFLVLISFGCLCVSIKTNPFKNKFLTIFLTILLVLTNLYFYKVTNNFLKSVLDSINFCSRFFIILGTGFVYTKFLPPSEVIFLIRKLLPKKSSLIIPILVAFRGLPIGTTITKNILIAQKARGLTRNIHNVKNGKRFFGTFFTAFFAAFIDFLFVFSTTVFLRGINNNTGTVFRQYNFKISDFLILLYLIVLIACVVFGDGAIEMPY